MALVGRPFGQLHTAPIRQGLLTKELWVVLRFPKLENIYKEDLFEAVLIAFQSSNLKFK